ncbi:MAG: c-type cytochrome [Vicinamibacterales bacterium]
MSVLHRIRAILATSLAVVAFSAASASAQSSADHQYTSADIEAGSRLYANQCALCHGANGDGVNGIDLRRGIFRRSVSDEDVSNVISTGIASVGMPSFKFQPAELTAVLAFIRAGFDPSGTAVRIGRPASGKTLFAGKGGCTSCHRVDGVGPRTAPDLSDIGAIRTPSALQRSLVNPTSAMLPINRPVRAVTKDGRTIQGRRLNEDTYTVQLIDDREQLVTLVKADLRTYELGKTSPMPTAAAKSLSSDEIADLVAYLLTLKGQ